jgi:hypothetical protein
MYLIPELLVAGFEPGVPGPLPPALLMTMSTDCEWDFHLPRRFLVRLPSFDMDAASFHWRDDSMNLHIGRNLQANIFTATMGRP